jgi:hypothetical protein
MSGDSVVQVLVVDGMVRGAGEGLLALAVDVELRAWDSFFGIWTFRSFWWRRRRFTPGHDGIAQGLFRWA